MGIMENFKDFDLETVARLVYPRRQQISLLQMMRSRRIKDFFAEPKPCLAVTPGVKPYSGKLSFHSSQFLFHLAQPIGGIRNGQLLLLVFSIDEVDYCVQVASGQVFREYFVLQPIQARYHKRYLIKAPALVYPVSQSDAEAIVSGKALIRRIRSSDQSDIGIKYFVRELMIDQLGSPIAEYPRINTNMLAALMQDLSQGGCAIAVQNTDEKLFRDPKMLYFEVTLNLGNRVGNLACFAVKKGIISRGSHALIRCAFLETLPLSIGSLKDGTDTYELSFDNEVRRVMVNGKDFNSFENFTLRLPHGMNTIDIEWCKGVRERHRLLINPETPKKIYIKAS